jgi:hypothetical protein
MRPSRRHSMIALAWAFSSVFAVAAHPRGASAQRGPKTSRDTIFFMMACPHDESLHPSEYTCPDSTNRFKGTAMKSATLTVTLTNGKTFTQKIAPGTDALFLSNHALEKFLLPYYESVGNTTKVAAIHAFLDKLGAASAKSQAPAKPN